jgi:outer membrane protein assembly factor BamE (lipoprotein component of BamABCDE complex)
MTTRLKLLAVGLLLAVSACLSAGTQAITDTDTVAKIEAGKSTRADVTALLGYPITASYGKQGQETWHYTCITTYPKPGEFVPVVKAFAPNLQETTRELSVTFNQDGTVKNLAWGQPPKKPGPAG